MAINNELTHGEILPGWHLVTGEWNGPVIGLSTGNHPEFLFQVADIPGGGFLTDPLAGMSDEAINAIPDGSLLDKASHRFGAQIDYVEEQLHTMPMVGYHLVNASIAAGYNPEEDGYRHTNWLLDRMAQTLQNTPVLGTPTV